MYRKKTTIIIVMCIAILVMGVGYALLSTRLNISGSTVVTSSWRVEFSEIRTMRLKGGASNITTPKITATTATFNVDLVQPGDEVIYEVDITNFGDIDAEVKGATFSVTGSEAIYVEIDKIRKGTIIEKCEGADVCPSVTMDIIVGYDPAVEKDPTEKTKTIEITIEIGQYVSTNPTPDGELIPELVEKNTLVQKILRDNTATSDIEIDFSAPPSLVYGEVHSEEEISVTINSSTTKYQFGSGYTFDATSGYYILTGTKNDTWSNMSSSYTTYKYTCLTSGTYCYDGLYKITEYTSTTQAQALKYTSELKGHANGYGLYYTSTNTQDGRPSYYFRGDVGNNYVSFGTFKESYSFELDGSEFSFEQYDPIIWRIVRINEDGSIRLISDQIIETSAFNVAGYQANTGVGYMLGLNQENDNYEDAHSNSNDSTIKQVLDTWYREHLSSYSSLFAENAGFCNDRSVAPYPNIWDENDTALGYGQNKTYYGAHYRGINNKPQFACPNESNDLFTLTTSNRGNKKLTAPIGLLTMDELLYAGGVYFDCAGNYYLLSTYGLWYNMSPIVYDGVQSQVGFIWDDNCVDYHYVLDEVDYGVRPVVNLKADIEIVSGDGSEGDPYLIKTN